MIGFMISIIAQAIYALLGIVEFAIMVSVLMSWIPQAQDTKFASYLKVLTEPILLPIRELTNRIIGGKASMLDFSPIFAVILLQILKGIARSFFK